MSKLRRQRQGRPRAERASAGPAPTHEPGLLACEDELESFRSIPVAGVLGARRELELMTRSIRLHEVERVLGMAQRFAEAPMTVFVDGPSLGPMREFPHHDPLMVWFDEQADFSSREYERLWQQLSASRGETPERFQQLMMGMLCGGGKSTLARQAGEHFLDALIQGARDHVLVLSRDASLEVQYSRRWRKDHLLLVAPATVPAPRTEPHVRNRTRAERRAAQRRRRARGWR